jgi:hypothetical protein
MKGRVGRLATAAAVLVLIGAACDKSDPPQPPAQSRLDVAPGGRGDCSRANPCGDLDAAIARAGSGSEIVMAAGSYPRQSLTRRPMQKLDRNMVIRAAPDTVVTVASLRIATPHITLRDIRVEGDVVTDKDAEAHHLRLEKLKVRNGTVFFNNADHSAIVESEISEGVNRDGINVKDGSDDVLLEGNFVHDMRADRATNERGVHVDCLQVFNASRVTIRSNRFLNCSQRAVLVQTTADIDTKQISISNNVFGPCLDSCQNAETPFQATGEIDSRSQDRDFKAKARDYRIVNNVIEGYAFVEPVKGLVFRNNILRRFFHPNPRHLVCNTAQEGHNLVAERGACSALSPTDRLGWPLFVDLNGSAEPRISPSNTVDLGFADRSTAPARDYFGSVRCGPPDVGAHEQGCGV